MLTPHILKLRDLAKKDPESFSSLIAFLKDERNLQTDLSGISFGQGFAIVTAAKAGAVQCLDKTIRLLTDQSVSESKDEIKYKGFR